MSPYQPTQVVVQQLHAHKETENKETGDEKEEKKTLLGQIV